MTTAQADILIFFVVLACFVVIAVGWVVIDYLRRLLDALHTLLLRGSERRGWEREP